MIWREITRYSTEQNEKGVKIDEPFGSILYLDDNFHIRLVVHTIRSDTHDQREVLRNSICVRLVHDYITITHE